MSLAEIKSAVCQLSPKELAELAAFVSEQDKLAWDKELEEDFAPGESTKRRWRRLTRKLSQGISRRLRDFAGAEVVLEVLPPVVRTRSEARGQEFRAVQG